MQRTGAADRGLQLADRLAQTVADRNAGPVREDIDREMASTFIRLACVYRFRSGFDRVVPQLLREATRAVDGLRGGISA